MCLKKKVSIAHMCTEEPLIMDTLNIGHSRLYDPTSAFRPLKCRQYRTIKEIMGGPRFVNDLEVSL